MRIASARRRPGIVWLCLLPFCACSTPAVGAGPDGVRELEVTATAFNSLVGQTTGEPALTAWGDRLQPGMLAIAVSRDLIEKGLRHGVEVEIVGLEGRYKVLDKMAGRWRRRIDIYMGEDVAAAREWGRRSVRIRWRPR